MYRYLFSILAITTPWTVNFYGKTNYYSDYISTKLFPGGNEDTFDFIIVGAGASGAVVARRLATVPSTRVLLLEAGGNPSPLNHVPGIALDLLHYPDFDWMHKSVPQKYGCQGLVNKQSSLNSGKVLGGSTTLNFMMYLRGHPKDYDTWANVTGDPAWSYKNCLPHFKKSLRDYKGNFVDNKEHYSESPYGFLHVEKRKWAPLFSEFIEAGKEFGFPTIDANGGSQKPGFGTIEVTQKKGTRYGTYLGILVDLESRPNVKISRFSEVTKIKFGKNMRAEGVHYLHHGVKKFARATKELIISAGAINSPKLLMLSGVGPKAHLKSLKIKTKLDLPVGKNLQDHVVTPVLPLLVNESVSFVGDRDFGEAMLSYATEGSGALATPNAGLGQSFIASSIARKAGHPDWPDVQSFYGPAGIFSVFSASVARGFNLRKDILEFMTDEHMRKDGFSFFPCNTRPKSRGEVLLKSRNPLDSVLIDPRYYEHPDDLTATVDAIEKLLEVFENAKSYKKYNTYLPNKKLPGCDQHQMRSRAYWECYTRHWSVSIWHPTGTCRMGAKGDKTAVVDTKLRVFGTKALRVADASIMPQIVNANTMAPCFMIGEKVSDFIRDLWAQQFLVCDLKAHLLKRDADRCYFSRLV